MDGVAIPKNPALGWRRKGLVLALASACVFSVAVIGRTHPPFPGAPEPRGGVASLVWGSCTRRRRARGAEFYPTIR